MAHEQTSPEVATCVQRECTRTFSCEASASASALDRFLEDRAVLRAVVFLGVASFLPFFAAVGVVLVVVDADDEEELIPLASDDLLSMPGKRRRCEMNCE